MMDCSFDWIRSLRSWIISIYFSQCSYFYYWRFDKLLFFCRFACWRVWWIGMGWLCSRIYIFREFYYEYYGYETNLGLVGVIDPLNLLGVNFSSCNILFRIFSDLSNSSWLVSNKILLFLCGVISPNFLQS